MSFRGKSRNLIHYLLKSGGKNSYMSRENYKNRPIFDVTGKELTEQEKEAAYNLTSNILDSVEEDDESKKSIDQYLLLNYNYKAANLSNNNKPFESWTSNEILTMIRKCRKNTGLGSVGRFEASDELPTPITSDGRGFC